MADKVNAADCLSHCVKKRRHAAGGIILFRHLFHIFDVTVIMENFIAVAEKYRCHADILTGLLLFFNHGIETADRITGQVAHGAAFIKNEDHFHTGRFYFLCRFFFRRSSLPEKKRR